MRVRVARETRDHARLGAWFRRDASPQASVASPIPRTHRTEVRGGISPTTVTTFTRQRGQRRPRPPRPDLWGYTKPSNNSLRVFLRLDSHFVTVNLADSAEQTKELEFSDFEETRIKSERAVGRKDHAMTWSYRLRVDGFRATTHMWVSRLQ
jgi:hypothetical protein